MQHNNNHQWRILMPNKKPSTKKETPENAPEKAIVSELGVNEKNPVPEKSGDVTTRHGSTIHYS